MRLRYFIALLSLTTSFASIAQSGTIRGFVYDQETGEPVIFTNVFLEGTSQGAATDVNGYYSITKVENGTYQLTCSSLGFAKTQKEVTVKNGQIITAKLYLEKASFEMQEVIVSAEKRESMTQVQMSVAKITPKEIEIMPSIGGEADIAQYLQVLPGVIFTGDQGGQLYIRGGSPIQNKVLLDGMVIYNPFHSIGLFSVFDTDVIRNADVYTGGFNAKYGGRISSIMDITTKDGNNKTLGGKVSISPFSTKIMMEGPLKKRQENGSSTSFLVSAKQSYLDRSSKLLYSYIDEEGLPFSYTDLYGKITFNGGNGSKFNFFAFNFTDQVKYQAVSDLNWNNFGVGSNFVLVPSGSPVLVEGNFSYSTYGISLVEEGLSERSSTINNFDVGFDFKYFSGANEIKYGIDISGFTTGFKFFNDADRTITQNESTSELSSYISYKLNKGNLVIEPSFRAHYYASLSELSLEPRIGAKWNITEKIRLKAAAGKYSQNLISANSDRDVVNLFYGFLAGPENLQKEIIKEDGSTSEITSALQTANHLIVGTEFDLSDKLTLNVEGYVKYFTQLSNLNRNKIFDDVAANNNQPDYLKKDFIIETGTAKGLDFLLKYKTKQFYFWAVYSLGKVDRWDGIQTYAPVFDRRHNVNLLGSYSFGKDNSYEFNVRWNLGSGLPFTQTQGVYENPDFESSGVATDVTTANGSYELQYASLNGGRLPTYHRLDINLKKRWKKKKSTIEASIGATNVYARENIFYFDRVKFERVNQLPLLPSAGVSFTF
ncbi:MAG: hypothetical protein ACJAUV_000400 [Flavobacteriales bacterium]|jgi:hypothetical protein